MSASDLTRVLLFIVRAKDIKGMERSTVRSPNDMPNERYYILLPPPFYSYKREFCNIRVSLLEEYNMDWFEDDLIKGTDDSGEGVVVLELLLEVHPPTDKLTFYTKENNRTTVCRIFAFSDFMVQSIDESQFRNLSFPWTGDRVVRKVFSIVIEIKYHRKSSTLLQQLFGLGVDINAIGSDPERRTLLHEAAWRGEFNSVQLLVRHGADVNAGDRCGQTPLFVAVKAGHRDAVATLTAAGANVDIRNTFGFEFDARGNIVDVSGRTILHEAAKLGDCELLAILIKYSNDLNVVCQSAGMTPLGYAILGERANAPKLVKLLLENGAVPIKGNPVVGAARIGQVEVVKLLCEFGARGDIVDGSGRTALHEAAKRGDCELLNILIKYSNDVNVVCRTQHFGVVYITPLVEAILGERPNLVPGVVKLLLENGADPNANFAIIMAAELKQVKTVKLLCEFGARAERLCQTEWKCLWKRSELISEHVKQILFAYDFDMRIYDSARLPTYISMNILKEISKYGDCRVLSNETEYIDLLRRWLKDGTETSVNTHYSHENGILKYLLEYNAKYLRPSNINLVFQDGLMNVVTTEVRDIFFVILIRINMIDIESSQTVQELSENYRHFFSQVFNGSIWIHDYVRRHGLTLFTDCLAELRVLKKTYVGDNLCTLYDVLTKDVHLLAILAKNDKFASPLVGTLKFRNYGRILNHQHQKSCHMRKLVDRAMMVSDRAFGNLPDEIAEIILENLNARDLLVFETACYPAALIL